MSEHIIGNIDRFCYPCNGTGKVIGHGRSGQPCKCLTWCSNHDAYCNPEDDE